MVNRKCKFIAKKSNETLNEVFNFLIFIVFIGVIFKSYTCNLSDYKHGFLHHPKYRNSEDL